MCTLYFDAICENLLKQISIDLISFMANLSCELGQTNDQIQLQCSMFEMIPTLPNFGFGQLM